MSGEWVDFAVVKRLVPIGAILERYQVNWLQGKGSELRGRCPIHKGEGERAFHVNVSKNAFHCFSCGAKGNVLDFVAAMEHCSVRDAAVKLQDWFAIATLAKSEPPAKRSAGRKRESGKDFDVDHAELGRQLESPEAAVVNPPLPFTLKGISPSHPYFEKRGISRGIAEYFGAGFFSGKGSMSGRVVIPIHNERGELVAYAGRSIDDSEPRYKLPSGFHKALVMFNVHRVLRLGEDRGRVVVVEGFFDCMKIAQAGALNVVALMGCTLSEAQQKLLSPFREVVLMLDGDEAGRAASAEIALRLTRQCFVRVMTWPANRINCLLRKSRHFSARCNLFQTPKNLKFKLEVRNAAAHGGAASKTAAAVRPGRRRRPHGLYQILHAGFELDLVRYRGGAG